MKKLLIPVLLIALVCLLTGCASKTEADTLPSPAVSPMTSTAPDGIVDDLLPDAAMTPGAAGTGMGAGSTVNTTLGVTTAARAREAVEKLEEELERLSEVDGAEVVLAGTTAVVALDFDAQYQSGVTSRIEKMVRERIDSVVTGVENVIVTDDGEVSAALQKLGDRLDGAADMTEMEAELKKLIDRIRNMA